MGGASQPYKHVHECREEGGRQEVRTCADELVQTDLTLGNSVWSVWSVCVCGVCVCGVYVCVECVCGRMNVANTNIPSYKYGISEKK